MENDFDWLLNKARLIFSSWKQVLIGWIALFAVGAAILFMLPPKYTSRSVLPLAAGTKAVLWTEIILDPVAQEIYPPGRLVDAESARQSLARSLTLSPELGPGSGLYTLSHTDKSPKAAQAVLSKIVDRILAASRPTGTARADAMNQVETLVKAKDDLEAFAATLKEKTNRLKDGSEGELYARALAVLISDIAAKKSKIQQLTAYLEGPSREDILLWPTLPDRPNSGALATKLLSVAIGSLALMIFAVLVLHSWRQWRGQSGTIKSPDRTPTVRVA